MVCRVPRVPMLHLHLYMFESPAPGACLADCLSASFLLYIHISPTTNQYTSQFVSRLYQQQQQQIAVQQYKVRARVRDIFYIRIRHQIFQAQIEAGQTLFVYHISYFYFRHNKDYKLQVQNFLFPYSVFCRSNKSNTKANVE